MRILLRPENPIATPKTGLWKITGSISNGQSLSVGIFGNPLIETFQPYSNVQLFDSSTNYDITQPLADTLSLIPLVAQERSNTTGFGDEQYAYPHNLDGGVAPDIGALNTLTALYLADGYQSFVLSTSNTGQSGQDLSVINKGGSGNAYAAGLYEITAIKNLTKTSIVTVVGKNPVTIYCQNHGFSTGQQITVSNASGMTELNGTWTITKANNDYFYINGLAATHTYSGDGYFTSFGVDHILFTHGESDTLFIQGTYDTYGAGLITLINNYNADIPAITGQNTPIYMVVSQQNSYGFEGYSSFATNYTSQTIFQLINQSPYIFISGPKYQYPYVSNGPHLTSY